MSDKKTEKISYSITTVERKEENEMKSEAKAYAIKLIGLAEMVEDVSKSKNGRYEFCGDLGARNKKIHIYRGIGNLAEDLGFETLSKVEHSDDAYEFKYLGYSFFQILSKDADLGEEVSVGVFKEYTEETGEEGFEI